MTPRTPAFAASRRLGARVATWAVATALAIPLAGCGGGEQGERTARSTDAAAANGATAVDDPARGASRAGDATDAGGGGCRLAGDWQRCSVVESVEQAGYRLEMLRDSVVQPGLPIPGAAYRLGSAELQLFLFADSAAAARAAAAVDVDDAEPADTRGILRPPAVIRSNNLVALLFDNNDRLRERVQLAIAAGLPPA